jgi:membrane dipeptidase
MLHQWRILPPEVPMNRAVSLAPLKLRLSGLCGIALLAAAAAMPGCATNSRSAHGAPEVTSPPVLDLHTDILLRVIDHGVDLASAPQWTQVNLDTMEAGNVQDQVFAVWVSSRDTDGLSAAQRALQMIDLFEEQAARHSDRMVLATTVAESDRIRASGRIAVWLWVEGGIPIAEDLAMLRTFHRLGVRGMTLTWTNNLSWAGSSSDRENDQMGLTEFGREVVREMNRIGMIVDVSHVSERTFYDALEVTTKPVVASHSGCRALCENDRNLTDDQLRAIAANGGVVGIAAFSTFLKDAWNEHVDEAEEKVSAQIDALRQQLGENRGMEFRDARRRLIQSAMPDEAQVTIDDYVDHIEHAIKIAGPKHVAIGSDFDGISAFPLGLERASDWPKVAEAMRKRGFDEQTIRDVFSENARRVFREVLDGE